jgi:hypothetical protein
MIGWFTPYVIKPNIGVRGEEGSVSVALHRHAALRLEPLAESKEDPPADTAIPKS